VDTVIAPRVMARGFDGERLSSPGLRINRMSVEYLAMHNQHAKDGVSRWIAIVNKRRRLVELQKWKGRLYLVGSLVVGNEKLLPFEATLKQITNKLGKLELARVGQKRASYGCARRATVPESIQPRIRSESHE
jgi:hypothetical protein